MPTPETTRDDVVDAITMADAEVQKPQLESQTEPLWWWVNQGQQFRNELQDGYLWAPTRDRSGSTQRQWSVLEDLAPGDIVLHYANQAIQVVSVVTAAAVNEPSPSPREDEALDAEGDLVRVEPYSLQSPIRLVEIPIEWRIEGEGPFDKNGGIKQGYMFPLDMHFVTRLADRFATKFPDGVVGWANLSESEDDDAVDAVRRYAERLCPNSEQRRNILNLLADSILTVNSIAPSGWAMNGLRLTVGRGYAFYLDERAFILVLDVDKLDENIRIEIETAVAGEAWRFNSMPFAYGVPIPIDRLDEFLPLVRDGVTPVWWTVGH